MCIRDSLLAVLPGAAAPLAPPSYAFAYMMLECLPCCMVLEYIMDSICEIVSTFRINFCLMTKKGTSTYMFHQNLIDRNGACMDRLSRCSNAATTNCCPTHLNTISVCLPEIQYQMQGLLTVCPHGINSI